MKRIDGYEYDQKGLRCPICNALVIVRRKIGSTTKVKTLRVLAMADHIWQAHPATSRAVREINRDPAAEGERAARRDAAEIR